MIPVMTLAEFLLARIAEDEAAANVRSVTRRMIRGQMVEVPITARSGVWAWSPDRVLAECEAKRRIVEGFDCYSTTRDAGWMVTDIFKMLALPYADHPDYQQEWKP